MATVSNLLILLDLIEAGMQINQRVSTALRQAELEGRNVTAQELEALAQENDKLYDEVMKELE